ncbi:MAG TPA: hypothetical protein VGB30_08325 [bacterium]|jgi:hypothetical protein
MLDSSGTYPFFLLGLRRVPEYAKYIARVSAVLVVAAYIVPLFLIITNLAWKDTFIFIDPVNIAPNVVYAWIAGSVYAACFLIPFFAVYPSELFFNSQWRANTILLVSPLSSRALIWGKFGLLIAIGLPIFGSIVLPLGIIFMVFTHAPQGTLTIGLTAFFVYFCSSLFLSTFSRRWEAVLFWVFLAPVTGYLIGVLFLFSELINALLMKIYIWTTSRSMAPFLPAHVNFPNLPFWAWMLIIVILTFWILVFKGAREIERLRSGQIPLGKMAKVSEDQFQSRHRANWYWKDREVKKEVPDEESTAQVHYVPVDLSDRKKTSTDYVFDICIWLMFFGKYPVKWLSKIFLKPLRSNPIFMKGTNRFLKFIDGTYEPSIAFKNFMVSRLFMYWFFFLYPVGSQMFLLNGYTLYASGKSAFSEGIWKMMPWLSFIWLTGVAAWMFWSIMTIIKNHREKMDWESVILTPTGGSDFIKGTFGTFVTNNIFPYLVHSLWFLVLAILAGLPFMKQCVAFAAVAIIFNAAYITFGFASAAISGWMIANSRILSIFNGFAFSVLIICFAIYAITVINWGLTGSNAVFAGYPLLLSTSAALFAISFILIAAGGGWFDSYGRVPLERKIEEGE